VKKANFLRSAALATCGVALSTPGTCGDATVHFPGVSGARALTSGPKEHLFASYYGITSWDSTGRYALVLETDVRNRLPTEDNPAALVLVDMEEEELRPLARTRAWNFQQGCMAHWLDGGPRIVYNDLRDGRFVSVVMDALEGEELRVIPHPVSAVSPDGREAISLNFARLRHTRTDYGYGGGGQDARMETPFPRDDGLFRVDLETGDAELIVSIAQVKDVVPEVPEGGVEYFNHTLFSRDGSRVFWLARATPERNTTSLTVRGDGKDLRRCFPDGWGGSHFDWLDDDELMVTAEYEGLVYGHILFTVGKDDYRRLGRGLLDYDGHGTFSPDGRWMVTDTYPAGGLREQKLFLMDMRTEAVLPLGRFVQPDEFTGRWRCDLHPRWSPGGDRIGFNSTHTGSRQVYVIELTSANE
jgi:hypothetical protein